MKDVVIIDIKRKTNLDRKVLREAARLAYDAIEKQKAVEGESELPIELMPGFKERMPQQRDNKN